MTLLIGPPARQRRRRHSREFKAQIVSACQQPGVSVSGIALKNGLNANLVRRWIKEARAESTIGATPGFIALTAPEDSSKAVCTEQGNIRITVPRVGGAVIVEWPASEPASCAAFLQALLR